MSRLPIDCVLAITYNCNARCTMCDIWKIKNFPELPPEEYLKLPNTLRDVNISGGEPFLRKDIADIIANVVKAAPKARMVISTNGFLTDLVAQRMKKILEIKPDIGVAVSIDGIGEMHDEVRGIPGGFKRDMETIQMLKKLGMRNLRLAFTITERNVNHFSKVYDLTRELDIQFTHSYAQSSEFYFGGKRNKTNPRRELLDNEYGYILRRELGSWDPKRWARAFFAHGMHSFITSKTPVLSNAPGRDFFYLDPNGVIYPSVVHNIPMGNIREVSGGSDLIIPATTIDGTRNLTPPYPPHRGEQRPILPDGMQVPTLTYEEGKYKSFEQFWCSPETEAVRKQVDASKVPAWMICTARTAIKKHPIKVAWWVARNKMRGTQVPN